MKIESVSWKPKVQTKGIEWRTDDVDAEPDWKEIAEMIIADHPRSPWVEAIRQMGKICSEVRAKTKAATVMVIRGEPPRLVERTYEVFSAERNPDEPRTVEVVESEVKP